MSETKTTKKATTTKATTAKKTTATKTSKPAVATKAKPVKKVEKKKEEIVKVDIVDVLLDEKNTAPIYMFNDKGEQIEFDQIAVIPYGDDELYCILKPITKINGIKDDEAVVFKVDQDENGEGFLKVEEREEVAIAVFDQYYNLIEEQTSKGNK